MNKVGLMLVFIFSLYASVPRNFESRFIGIVTEVKLISMDEDKNTIFWVKTDDDYFIKGKNQIPYIYVGDSLFEYWSDFSKLGVGTKNNLTIYELVKSDQNIYLK
jgi:hypothetical protein